MSLPTNISHQRSLFLPPSVLRVGEGVRPTNTPQSLLPKPPLEHRGRGKDNGRSAFTLLELLISLVIVSGITVTLFADLRLGFKARENSEAMVEPAADAEEAMNFLRLDFESVLSPNPSAATNAAGVFQQNFEAPGAFNNDDLLDFYTTAEGPEHIDANGEIKLVGLALEAVGNDHVLVRRVTRNLTAAIQPNPDEEVICRGVSSVQFEYFDGTQWQPSWDSTVNVDINNNPALPLAVRVTLELQRPQPGGQLRTYRFARVFQLACSTLVPGSSSSSTGGSGL